MSQMPEATFNYYHNAFGLSLYSCAIEIIPFPDHKMHNPQAMLNRKTA